MSGLGQARAALSEAEKRVYKSYDEIRRFMNSHTFTRLEGEREVAVHLSQNDSLAAAAHAPGTSRLIDDRLKSIEHDLSRLDDDLKACIEELDHLLGIALHIVRRMIRDGRIPDHVPRFGGQPVFRISADLVPCRSQTPPGDSSQLHHRSGGGRPGPGRGARRSPRRWWNV